MLKIGLLGCGGMGITHSMVTKRLSEDLDIQIVAVADGREEFRNKVCEDWPGAVHFENALQLIEEADVDVIDICLPTFLHARMAQAAMQKGRHVFVEKPLCLTEDDCQMLLEEQAKSGVQVMVGQVVRFEKEFRLLKEIKDDMRYGRLKSIVLRRISPNVTWGAGGWFHDENKSGGAVIDLHVHDIDYLRFLLGEPDEFQVQAAKYYKGMINHIVTTYQFGKTFAVAEGIFDESDALPFRDDYRACFEYATVERLSGKTMIYEVGKDGQRGRAFEPVFEEEEVHSDKAGINITDQGPHLAELRDFYTTLLAGKEITSIPLSEGAASVRQGFKEWQAAKEYIAKYGLEE